MGTDLEMLSSGIPLVVFKIFEFLFRVFPLLFMHCSCHSRFYVLNVFDVGLTRFPHVLITLKILDKFEMLLYGYSWLSMRKEDLYCYAFMFSSGQYCSYCTLYVVISF